MSTCFSCFVDVVSYCKHHVLLSSCHLNFEAFLVGHFSIFNMQIRTISAPQKEKDELDIFDLYHQHAYY
jgi:hypothetical protein